MISALPAPASGIPTKPTPGLGSVPSNPAARARAAFASSLDAAPEPAGRLRLAAQAMLHSRGAGAKPIWAPWRQTILGGFQDG